MQEPSSQANNYYMIDNAKKIMTLKNTACINCKNMYSTKIDGSYVGFCIDQKEFIDQSTMKMSIFDVCGEI